MSPTAAMNVAAAITFTPGTFINRLISAESSASQAISRSTAAISESRNPTWRMHPSTISDSSRETPTPAATRTISHAFPVTSNATRSCG